MVSFSRKWRRTDSWMVLTQKNKVFDIDQDPAQIYLIYVLLGKRLSGPQREVHLLLAQM